MSVLIKGMEMPERCGRCHFVRWSNLHQTAWCKLAQEACFENFSKDYKNRRADFCPLVDVSTPHGRLGDLDKLVTEFMDSDLDHLQRDDWKEVIQIVEDAPTIIEAEGSEE